jgi:hypothetical protein
MWTEFRSSLERTTNYCESFHSKFNRNFYSAKPNIFQFIDVLKEIQIEVYVKLRSTEKVRDMKSIQKQAYIKTEMEK